MHDWHVSLLSPPSSDTEPTLVVTFASGKYIFNVGEGTQRAFMQNWRGRKRTRGIFVTSVGTMRSGGLSGLLLGLADAGIKIVDVVGPEGLTHWLAASRLYTTRAGMTVKATAINPSIAQPAADPAPTPVFADQNVTVYAVPIIPFIPPSDEPGEMPIESLLGVDDTLELNVGAKRKRPPSPHIPSKRSLSDGGSDLPPAAPIEWSSRIQSPRFSSTNLRGEEAAEWRRWTLEHMFLPERQILPEGTRKAAVNPASWLQHLPTFTHSHRLTSGLPSLPSSSADSSSLSPPDYDNCPTLAYVVVGPRVRGKFLVDKVRQFGVPEGPLWRPLSRGQSVTFKVDDGTGTGNMVEKTVNPEECLGPSEAPMAMIVIDIPTPAYIPSLQDAFSVTNPFYAQFRSKSPQDAQDHKLHAVFHILGSGVVEDPRYREFMSGFGDNVQHIVSSKEYCANPITLTSAAFAQLKLSNLDPDMFPVQQNSAVPPKDLKELPGLPPSTTPWRAHSVLHVRPPKPLEDDWWGQQNDKFHNAIAKTPAEYIPAMTAAKFSKAKAMVQAQMDLGLFEEEEVRKPGDDVLFIPLGTSSSVPNKYRNVSGMLLRVQGWGSILLDAGEGTYGQIARHFGPEKIADVMRDLRCIFVSHQHGDHQSGVAKVLAMRRKLVPNPEQPIFLVTTYHVHLALREFAQVDDLGFNDPSGNGVRIIMSDALHWKGPRPLRPNSPTWTHTQPSLEEAQRLCESLGLESFRTVDVIHRCAAHGVVIKHKDGWSIVYSGDTEPCADLAEAGYGATLLIHEATMGDDQAEMAKAKAHSTFGQAVTIGRSMRARNVLLTHFSARYPKVPPSIMGSVVDADGVHMDIALAFDQSQIRIKDMWKMAHYLPAIEQSFADTVDDDDAEEHPPVAVGGGGKEKHSGSKQKRVSIAA